MRMNLVKMGNPILRKKTRQISSKQTKLKSFQKFLKNMVDTMRHAQGVGLAANQVGSNQRVMVMECRGNKRYPRGNIFPLQTYLNPRIIRYSRATATDWEGCLSIPGFRGKVKRSRKVTFAARTPDGRLVRKTFRGFEARVIQHEVDHLNGFFYVDRMRNLKSLTHLDEFNQQHQTRILDRD